MDNTGFEVVISGAAERNFYDQIVWLEQNRSLKLAKAFETAFWKLTDELSAQPFRWQTQIICGRKVRRAVIKRNWIVLYAVKPERKEVFISAIRGAAEDWTNQPIP